MAQDASQVREEIAKDRADLADTVQALASKADIKGRLRESVSKNAEQLQHKAKSVTPSQAQDGLRTAAESVRERPLPFALVGALLFGFLIGRLSGRGD